ncbi:unnamed protein product [Prorocentrum cordatum]|uniref:Uncharacterized protein n=1 Tax=Prorocentrum cordatum TaxID=2364126 RepID=A0ABN9PTG0_9DINO|nr:unnamed protein product [Polarella glacialis]
MVISWLMVFQAVPVLPHPKIVQCVPLIGTSERTPGRLLEVVFSGPGRTMQVFDLHLDPALHRELEGGLCVTTVNANSWGTLKAFLGNSDAHVVLAQEHRLRFQVDLDQA